MCGGDAGCVSTFSLGQIDGGTATTMIARADGVASGRGTMPDGLSTLHAASPIRLPFSRRARALLARLATSEGSRCSTQRTRRSRSASLRDAGKAAASIGGCCSADDSAATARAACNRTTSETGTASGKSRASRNNAASSKACSNRGSGAELGAARHQAVCDTRTEDTEAQQGKRREHQRHRVFDGWLYTAETCGELRKQGWSRCRR
ncbi:hypothetical protein ACVIHC_006777 [Bradyrhizobium diazoefficiens]